MSLKIYDPKNWRGRQRLHGKPSMDGNGVTYVSGPIVGAWTWESNANPLLNRLELEVYNPSLGAHDRVREKRIELERAGKLTASGIADEMAKIGAIEKSSIARAKQELANVKREVAERRAKIKPVTNNAEDDPVRRMEKIEIRNVIRGMSHRELMGALAGSNPDASLVQAVLETDPRMLPNVSPSLRRLIESNAVEAKFGPEIEVLDEVDRAIATAERAWSAAADGVEREIKGEGVELTRAAPSFAAG
jgi:hypothetical protein